jgi:hypothetical protein
VLDLSVNVPDRDGARHAEPEATRLRPSGEGSWLQSSGIRLQLSGSSRDRLIAEA